MRNTNVDHIWRTLGPLGKYQIKQIGTYLLTLISWGFQGLNIVFIGHRPDFQCKPSLNDSLVSNVTGVRTEYKQCKIVTYTNTSEGVLTSSSSCTNGWEYESSIDQSFVTEWDFVCENAELGELTQVLYLAGMIVGTFVFPTLSDRFGRKPVLVLSHVLTFGVSLGTAFSGNYLVFIVLRFLTGFFQQGLLAGTTLSLETLPTEIRHYCEVLALLSWTSWMCLMSPIAYAFRNLPWKYLQITYALCSVWSIFQWWFTDESLRWVIANGQIDKAKEIIKNACKWNKKNYSEVMEKIGWGRLVVPDDKVLKTTDCTNENKVEMEPMTGDSDKQQEFDNHHSVCNNGSLKEVRNPLVSQNNERTVDEAEVLYEVADDEEMKVQRYTMFDIFKYKRILIVSMVMWYTWICDSFVYYGLYMTSSDLYGDRYLNFFLSAAVEYLSAFIEYLCLARIGRKWTVIIGHMIAAIGLSVATGLTYTAGGNSGMLATATAFMLIGKMGITTGYSSVYLTTPELYPTNMRNIGLGVCSFMEKVGSMIAPFSRNVSSQIQWLPPCVFAVMCIITVILFAFVPETNGVELPQTIEELSDWYRVNKFELRVGKNRRATKNVEDTLKE